jgi:hypothetical protein
VVGRTARQEDKKAAGEFRRLSAFDACLRPRNYSLGMMIHMTM